MVKISTERREEFNIWHWVTDVQFLLINQSLEPENNACTNGTHNCDGNATCSYSNRNGYVCACNTNYYGDGTKGNCTGRMLSQSQSQWSHFYKKNISIDIMHQEQMGHFREERNSRVFPKCFHWIRWIQWQQESPAAWMQEAYRPLRSKYSFCCPNRGGYLIPGVVPHPWLGGTPSLAGRVPHPWPGGGYPIPSWGVPYPWVPPHHLDLDLAGVPPCLDLDLAGVPPYLDLAGVPPLHLDLAGGKTDRWTDRCQNITFPSYYIRRRYHFKKIAVLKPMISCVRDRFYHWHCATETQLTEKTVKLILIYASVISRFSEFSEFTEFNESSAPFRENLSIFPFILPPGIK